MLIHFRSGATDRKYKHSSAKHRQPATSIPTQRQDE